jgi:putative redox protein
MPSSLSGPDPVTVTETGAGRFQVAVEAAGARFMADEPVAAGGLGSGPNPYDLLASALGACTAMTLRLYAGRKEWPLENVSVRVLHTRDGLGGKDRFAREIVLTGALDVQQRTRLLEIANRCPVHRSLERGAEILTIAAQPPSRESLPPDIQGLLGDNPRGDDHRGDMEEACGD